MQENGGVTPEIERGNKKPISLLFFEGKMVPAEGFEPPTFGLQNRCTTTVLSRRLHFESGLFLTFGRPGRPQYGGLHPALR
jgi:hypothetical protein